MQFNKFLTIVTIALLFIVFFAPTAHAYMDPGTGSYLFQILIASAIGGLFVIKRSWSSIVGFLKQLSGGSGNKTDDR
ncbi:MAG: hypothetical protein ACQES4_08565 [Bacillota bacterium]